LPDDASEREINGVDKRPGTTHCVTQPDACLIDADAGVEVLGTKVFGRTRNRLMRRWPLCSHVWSCKVFRSLPHKDSLWEVLEKATSGYTPTSVFVQA